VLQQQQTQFLELYRAGLRTAADMMKASLESAERVQNQQLESIRHALEENVRSTRELAEVKSIDEMLTLQTRLTGTQLERSVEFWSRIWRAAGDTQMAMIGQMQSQVGQLGERMRETYAFTARTTEDATRFAATQAQSVASQAQSSAAGVRESATQERPKGPQERKSA
jgi:phasin family protein